MDAKAASELNSIKSELRSIISELDSISQGIRRDFKNIGNERCADCINKVTEDYRYALRKLNNIDTTTVTKTYALTHGGGGSSGGGGSGRSF